MYACVKFGSLTRGKADKFSDNDLLIVCPDKDRKSISENANFSMYNISFFSKKQLFLMRDKGSLFLQHIKKDGIIMYDEGGGFASFISNCQFSSPDIFELKRCESTLSFINSFPEVMELTAWKADFIYCVSRDYLIKKLAVKGLLAFGVDEIVSLSLECFNFKKEDFFNFKKFREIKSINRGEVSGSFPDGDLSSMINDWLNTLILIFDFKQEEKELNLIDCLSKRDYSSMYEALRCLEALYVLVEKKGINHIEHVKIIKYIKSPNLYRSLQSSKKTVIRNYFNDLFSFL